MFSIFLKIFTKYSLKIVEEVDDMSKNRAKLYIFLCVCLLSILITSIYFSPQTDIPSVYILTEYNGRLAVFIEGQDGPYTLIDTEYDSLPEADKKRLREGIEVNSTEELYRLIEDFSG